MRAFIVAMLLVVGCVDDVGEQTLSICDCVANPHSCCCTTPIVIDLNGDGIRLTSWRGGVSFNLNPYKGPSLRAWTELGTDDAWLYRDHTRNGLPDDGLELYGDLAAQAPPPDGESRNGFRALAEHDGNRDGLVDERDAAWKDLRLWRDADHDGVASLEEVSSLDAHGITGLSVLYQEPRRPDGHGNLFRYSAPILTAPGSTVGETAWDVSLSSPTPSERADAGLPEPVPASDEPPPSPAAAITVEPALTACTLWMTVSTPTYNSIGTGTVKTRAQWFRTTGTADTCPYSSNPTTVRLYEYQLGQWRSRVQTVGAMGDQQWKDAPRVCRFRRDRSWVGEADFIFTEPGFESLSRYNKRGNPHEWPCSEADTESDLPPCEQEP